MIHVSCPLFFNFWCSNMPQISIGKSTILENEDGFLHITNYLFNFFLN